MKGRDLLGVLYVAGVLELAWWVGHQLPWWAFGLVGGVFLCLQEFTRGAWGEFERMRAHERDPVRELAHIVVLAALRDRR